ncbi:IS630 family transposase [Nitrococcus mobilis]|uniref:IS630 family transposase n=1 Tax=Nitrococcus mobilis TaxID=35797 RepID=UPI0012EA95B2|nr:IS630 family transposase [Nitrococcus mobilis]
MTQKGSHQSRKVINALILLNCDEGEFNQRRLRGEDVAEVLKVSLRRLDRVKKRFVEEGLETALGGRPRQRQYERKADGDLEARLVALSCSEPPKGYSQWSLRLLADRAVELEYVDSLSYETVRRGFKKNEIKPWRRIGWVIPPEGSAEFVAAMERVLDVYRRPYDGANPVVCMDETPRQLIRETRSPLLPGPGRVQRHDYEYERCGVCNVFMATEPLAETRMTKVTDRKTKIDWAQFLQDIAERYADAERITLIMDNLNTHRPGALYEAFPPDQAKALWDRFEFIYTPKHGSWLNVAEIELNVMISQCLNRRIDTIAQLREQVSAWQEHRDQLQAKVNWQFTTQDARIKLKRLYPTFNA